MLQLIELNENIAVSGQPDPSDMPALAAKGVRLVICNRPDGEAPGQATMDDMQHAAEAAGMKFVRYPVDASNFPGDDLEGLGHIFDSSGKVFAYCRTGTRCANLWVASRSGTEKIAAAEQARAYGFDLSLAGRLR